MLSRNNLFSCSRGGNVIGLTWSVLLMGQVQRDKYGCISSQSKIAQNEIEL